MHYQPIQFSPAQIAIIEAPIDDKIFLEGPAGTGKTTVAVERMLYLMSQGVPGSEILVLVPQRTLGAPYLDALQTPGVIAGSMVSILTMGGLAKRMVELFWPLIAEETGFAMPDEPPIFLTLETAQYYMAHLVHPLIEEGYFDSITIDRNRLYSQIIDNLNKASVVGFSYTEIGGLLKEAWTGEPGQVRVYDDAQYCATLFREYCLANNLLDFSLQMEVFTRHLWHLPLCQDYLMKTYRHLITDNLEEDNPTAHDILGEWLTDFYSALLIFDQNAGYRRFLGADPESAYRLKGLCHSHMITSESYVTSTDIHSLEFALAKSLNPSSHPLSEPSESGKITTALAYQYQRYFPEMLDWVVDQIAILVHEEGIPPNEIVVLAPFLSDSLRFSLAHRLESHQIPSRSHRPSRSLREEPATQCLLTLSALAYPHWNIRPSKFDVAHALMQAIDGLDLVRAQLLTEIAYRIRDNIPTLLPFENIIPETQERITYRLGEKYDHLRLWLSIYPEKPQGELDHFLGLLFGEVLSQPGYGFHTNYDSGKVTANLIESVRKFRWVAGENLRITGTPLGKEYIHMVQEGVIAAQYIHSWQLQPEDAVYLAPAYTFLLSNRPVDVQFWLDVGSRGWAERLYQPLTHPYVLSRSWPRDTIWTDKEEVQTNQETLHNLILGLIRRCRKKVFLGLCELGEGGYDQRGPLLRAFQRVLRDAYPQE